MLASTLYPYLVMGLVERHVRNELLIRRLAESMAPPRDPPQLPPER